MGAGATTGRAIDAAMVGCVVPAPSFCFGEDLGVAPTVVVATAGIEPEERVTIEEPVLRVVVLARRVVATRDEELRLTDRGGVALVLTGSGAGVTLAGAGSGVGLATAT